MILFLMNCLLWGCNKVKHHAYALCKMSTKCKTKLIYFDKLYCVHNLEYFGKLRKLSQKHLNVVLSIILSIFLHYTSFVCFTQSQQFMFSINAINTWPSMFPVLLIVQRVSVMHSEWRKLSPTYPGPLMKNIRAANHAIEK